MPPSLTVASYIQAMSASHIPAERRGLWHILKQPIPEKLHRWAGYSDYPEMEPTMTSLCRWTDATIGHQFGESVMSDDPRELRKHLAPILKSRGRVLVSGLGLGCVVRGLLHNPAVTQVDVVEIDEDVIWLCGIDRSQFPESDPRLIIHLGDALTYSWPSGTTWDLAWHDVWAEDKPDQNRSTQILHLELLARYRKMATQQGAWALPRFISKIQKNTQYVGSPRV